MMKKIINKIRNHKKDTTPPSKITADTVAEHRKRVLAGGRRFKYPIQYERHKLVFNAIIIGIVTLIAALIVGWWQLYPEQNTSEFMYRVTRVLPMPVAKFDDTDVLYSDYLMKYRSSVHYLEQKEQYDLTTKDGQKQLKVLKQQSMSDAIADAYSAKLAREMNISVGDSELVSFLKDQRQTSDGEISEQTYNSVVLDYYNWTPAEYHYVVKSKLLRQKVAYALDTNATATINKVSDILKKDANTDFKSIVDSVGKSNANYGSSGWVPKTNQDGGLALAASKLEKGKISDVIKSTNGNGYYVVRLLDINDTKVSYEYVQVPLTVFNKKFETLKSSGKIKIYIDVSIN